VLCVSHKPWREISVEEKKSRRDKEEEKKIGKDLRGDKVR
jgi:hypothetical protein